MVHLFGFWGLRFLVFRFPTSSNQTAPTITNNARALASNRFSWKRGTGVQ